MYQFNIKSIKFIGIFILFTSLIIQDTKGSRIKLTNLKCNVTDKTFVRFERCRIRAISRDLQYYTILYKYLQIPVNDMQLRFRFLKRANGYKPFLYDFIVKCDVLKHMDPLKKLIWGWFQDVSNLNHSCPFTEDFEIKRLENRYLEKQLSNLPILHGDYAFFVDYDSYNINRFCVEFYVTIY